jgi:hypothetical protein
MLSHFSLSKRSDKFSKTQNEPLLKGIYVRLVFLFKKNLSGLNRSMVTDVSLLAILLLPILDSDCQKFALPCQ